MRGKNLALLANYLVFGNEGVVINSYSNNYFYPTDLYLYQVSRNQHLFIL